MLRFKSFFVILDIGRVSLSGYLLKLMIATLSRPGILAL